MPVPLPTGLDRPFHDALAAHELVLQRCECGTWQWPPEVICHRCRRFDPGWDRANAVGRVFSWTKVWHAAHAALEAAVPYVVAVVELPGAGNIRLVGNLLLDEPATAEVRIGATVRGEFVDHQVDGRTYTLLQWRVTDD
ncbi:OB-fold domain-containing protein [Prescottella defluvii]|nr:OB-fold domain-containing protein [Prescottella defluvii]